ncbi:retrovirus-related pol polyprotein from transposon TNT 1-94 [Tanacetum coccineum]
MQAKLDTKDVSIANLRKHIKSLKGKNVVEKVATPNNAKVITLEMFKLDLEPLAPRVLNNKDAHIDYIKHSREHADTLQEIVEHARALRPLDSDLDSACCPNYSMVFGLWMLQAYDRKPLSAHQLRNMKISRVYYVEGLGHNLLFVGQFCDSDLEVAFRKHTCYVRNLDGADLLSKSRDTNLYTISLDDMLKSSPICLLSKASKNKSWLWHRRLSHLNFDTLNQLAKHGLVRGLPNLKFKKDHLCSVCSLRKSKNYSHKPKADDTNQEKLYLLHMDLCGPMRVESINGKKYILVIVDDYSRFTWVKFLRSKDEAPEVIIKCLKQIQVRLNATVKNVRTDNGTEFVNQTLKDYYEIFGISHQTSVARTPQ